MLEVLHRDPCTLGFEQARWTLGALRQALPWLRLNSDSALHHLLERLHIAWKRARLYLRSPDAHYQAKCAYIAHRLEQVQAQPARFVLVYQDEMSFYRQPMRAFAYERKGAHRHPLARLSHRSNTRSRLAGCMNALTGQVHFIQRSKVGVDALLHLYRQLVTSYAGAETIFVVQDNWPVHFHPKLLAELAPQHWPWPFHGPPDWQALPIPAPRGEILPVQLLCLPTYASWLNPIEKLWRWLRQHVLHLHRLSDDWIVLKQRVSTFLSEFAQGSEALLRYVGLLPN